MSATDTLLDVQGLAVDFRTDAGVVNAVDGVDLHVRRGQILGLVGESGSGKSVTCAALLRLVPSPAGRIVGGRALFEGRDLLTLSDREMRAVRGDQIAMVFQDPMTSLNPYMRVGRQLGEVLELHRGRTRRQARTESIAMLEQVGIADPARRIDDFPHALSGGMRQRVMIAMALLCRPKLLLADEPTTALDVTIQAQILDLIRDLRERHGTSVLLVTHDLGVVSGLADDVLVMYAGQVVERAPVETLFARPAHPYTVGLLRSIPRLGPRGLGGRLVPIPGSPPTVGQRPMGCPFQPRCASASPHCLQAPPPVSPFGPPGAGHVARCHHPQAPP